MSVHAPVLSTVTEFDRVPVESAKPVLEESELSEVYSLNDLTNRIVEQNYKQIALQFPDDLIQDSTHIGGFLRNKFTGQDRNVYILADTSYSPCCVDEVAAKHVNADVVVHFGNACLNPVRSIPVIYVLDTSFAVDLDQVEQKFLESMAGSEQEQHILLVAETNYSVVLDDLYKRIFSKFPNCLPTSIYSEETKTETGSETGSNNDSRDNICCNKNDSSNPNSCCHKKESTPTFFIPTLNLLASHTESSFLSTRRHPPLKTDLSNYKVFYITSSTPSPSFVLHLTTLVSSVTLLDIQSSPYKLSIPRSALQKRYRYMNVARTASTIGILINTLSLRNINDVLLKVKSSITKAGKKHYTFVVGKPNVAKLANFDVVDIWVVLGCSIGGIIVNCDEFYKPIITPYELDLSLQTEVQWSGKWLIDFESILNDEDEQKQRDQHNDEHVNEDDDAPVFNPITGKYVSTSKPLRRRPLAEHIEIEHDNTDDDDDDDRSSGPNVENALATRMTSQLAIRGTVSTAAEYLHSNTTWKGLGSDFDDQEIEGEVEGATIKQGRGGIARGYRVGDTERT